MATLFFLKASLLLLLFIIVYSHGLTAADAHAMLLTKSIIRMLPVHEV